MRQSTVLTGIKAVEADGLRVYPSVRNPNWPEEVEPLDYSWEEPTYHERKKQSYEFLNGEFEGHE